MPNILMPALSPTMEEGKLSKWLVKEGDTVKPGDVLAEIETDKATMEVESVDSGKVDKLLVAEGTEGVKVNTPIALVLDEGEAAPDRAAGQGRAGERRQGIREARSGCLRARRLDAGRQGDQGTRRAGLCRCRRSRSSGRRRDGRDDRPPGAQRGDGRGAAPRPRRLRHGRGGRRVSGRLQDHPGPAAGVRSAAHRRYADHRARLCRPRDRRGLCRAAADRRVHDLELCHAGDRPDHQQRGQAALHVGRAGDGADRLPRPQRRRGARRCPAQPGLLGVVQPRPRPLRHRAVLGGRRQGPAQGGDPLQQPGRLPRERDPLRRDRSRCPRSTTTCCRSARRASRAPART